MRTEVGRLARDELSFLAFRIWFNDADRRAHYGAPSGLADPVAMALADEIITILFDLDDGFIQGDEMIDALQAAAAKPREFSPAINIRKMG